MTVAVEHVNRVYFMRPKFSENIKEAISEIESSTGNTSFYVKIGDWKCKIVWDKFSTNIISFCNGVKLHSFNSLKGCVLSSNKNISIKAIKGQEYLYED